MLVCSMAWTQTKILQGTVTDENNFPLPGAAVMIQGTQQGTQTDFDGNFSIRVAAGGVIEVSYVGFKPQTIHITTQTRLDVKLETDVSTLDEVVVVAYGSTRKEDLTTSVATINLDQNFKSRPANMASMIQGQMPGVTVQSGGGDPFRDGTTISVRGRGSRGSDGNPSSGDGVLVIVDGVPNAPYNVEDVESISVLKDAASAAMYGAYVGSGGVIVITTKKAKSGKLSIDINSSTGFSQAWRLPEIISSEDFIRVKNDAYAQNPTVTRPAVIDIVANPYFGQTRTNWFDEVFRSASVMHHALSLSGGSEKISAFGSFSYDKKEGTLINTHLDIIGAKTNVSFSPTSWLTLRENVTYKYTNGQGGLNNHNHEGVLMSSVFFPRNATIYDYLQNGEMLYDDYGNPLYHGTVPRFLVANGISGYGEIRNPVATLQRLREYRPSHSLFSTTTLEIKPLEGLLVKSDFTAGLAVNRYENFSPKVPEIGRTNAENSRSISSSQHRNWLWETTAAYTKRLGQHTLDLMAGFNMMSENYRSFGVTVYNFDREDPFYTILSNGTDWAKTQPSESIWDESAYSQFGRLGYSYADRYFVTASIRRDATSKLYKDNNAGIFPAISGSWKISSERFFESLRPTVSLLKIRGSWGQIGNKNLVPRYSYNVAMGRSDWETFYGLNLDNGVRGVYQRTISNRNLKWETTEQTGFGIDLGIRNELEINIDYFNKLTKDLIERIPLASTAGILVEPYGNIGRVENKGWEIGVKYQKTVGNVNFNLFGNINTVKNTVLDIGQRDFMQHTVSQQSVLRSAVGQPWYSYYLLKTDGVFQNRAEIDSYTYTNPTTGATNRIQPNAQPGDLKYSDTNNDGIIDENDRVFMGSYLPTLTYAFGGGVNFKGIDFSLFFQGVSGVEVYNQFKAFGLTGRGESFMLADVTNSWEYNPNSGIPRMGFLNDDNGNYGNPSDFFLEDGSYLRLKNVTLGYTLPEALMQQWKMSGTKMRIYLNGENMLTFTKYTGFDPEVGNFGVDVGNYPVSRTYSMGININF
ncbi:MAG: TonB-dependent receptor [Capnocytophaga sp.]|nr:TonB-dependent receptor [Capnocytophaga sp.]